MPELRAARWWDAKQFENEAAACDLPRQAAIAAGPRNVSPTEKRGFVDLWERNFSQNEKRLTTVWMHQCRYGREAVAVFELARLADG